MHALIPVPRMERFQPVHSEIIIKQHVVGTNLIAPPTNRSASFNEDLEVSLSWANRSKRVWTGQMWISSSASLIGRSRAPPPQFLSASAGAKRIKKTGRQPDGTWKVMLDFRWRVERDRLNAGAGRFNKVCHAHARRADVCHMGRSDDYLLIRRRAVGLW